jgi:hypothetical protein
MAATGRRPPMPVGVELEFRSVTLRQYDEFSQLIGFLAGGPAPTGVLFHRITKTDDGFGIKDVWESRDAFEVFSTQMIVPHFQEIGVRDAPEIRFFEVHNSLAGSRWRS